MSGRAGIPVLAEPVPKPPICGLANGLPSCPKWLLWQSALWFDQNIQHGLIEASQTPGCTSSGIWDGNHKLMSSTEGAVLSESCLASSSSNSGTMPGIWTACILWKEASFLKKEILSSWTFPCRWSMREETFISKWMRHLVKQSELGQRNEENYILNIF